MRNFHHEIAAAEEQEARSPGGVAAVEPKIEAEAAAKIALEGDLRILEERTERQVEVIRQLFEEKKEKIRRGDELPPGVIKLVKVYVAMPSAPVRVSEAVAASVVVPGPVRV